jgi:hypothetical protein
MENQTVFLMVCLQTGWHSDCRKVSRSVYPLKESHSANRLVLRKEFLLMASHLDFRLVLLMDFHLV